MLHPFKGQPGRFPPHCGNNRPPALDASLPRPVLEDPIYNASLAGQLTRRLRLPNELKGAQVEISHWISAMLEEKNDSMRGLESFNMRRLGFYLSQAAIRDTKVAVVPECPVVPLERYGLAHIMPSGRTARGITFRNVYFLKAGEEPDEGLHFHELVHSMQWRILGEEAFIKVYCAGLLQRGYWRNPLEVMAQNLERRYTDGGDPFDLVKEVRGGLRALLECKLDAVFE